MPEKLEKGAAELLESVAAEPSLDKFFERCPPLSGKEACAMLMKLRNERASWGAGRGSKGEGV